MEGSHVESRRFCIGICSSRVRASENFFSSNSAVTKCCLRKALRGCELALHRSLLAPFFVSDRRGALLNYLLHNRSKRHFRGLFASGSETGECGCGLTLAREDARIRCSSALAGWINKKITAFQAQAALSVTARLIEQSPALKPCGDAEEIRSLWRTPGNPCSVESLDCIRAAALACAKLGQHQVVPYPPRSFRSRRHASAECHGSGCRSRGRTRLLPKK